MSAFKSTEEVWDIKRQIIYCSNKCVDCKYTEEQEESKKKKKECADFYLCLLMSNSEITESAAALVIPDFFLTDPSSAVGVSAQGSSCNLI